MPVAAALRMEQEAFARRVVAALPRIVRQQLDWATAERIVQLLQGMHVDARARPDEAQLVYIERDGSSRGPLPQSMLATFIAPGDAYRLHGSQEWKAWPGLPEQEQPAAPENAVEEPEAAPVDEPFADAPVAPVDGEAEAPSVDAPSPELPQPLPETAVADPASAPMPEDELAPDDALIDPQEDFAPAATDDAVEPPAAADAKPARRSRFGRLLVLLLIIGAAAWAYQHWMVDTHVGDTPAPAPVGHVSYPAESTSAAPVPAASAESAAAVAASTAPASAGSTPAPAASVPASASTAALPTAAVITPAAASSAAPAPATTTPTAPATDIMEPAPPTASSSPGQG